MNNNNSSMLNNELYSINDVALFGQYLFCNERIKMILEAFKEDNERTNEQKIMTVYKADMENFIEFIKQNKP